MAEITAAAVKAFRERTGLPLMACKQALTEAGGDEEKAIEELRKRGKALAEKRGGRATEFGRFGIVANDTVGAMVELKCESAPVTSNEEFLELANDLAVQLANGPGAATADEQPGAPDTLRRTLGQAGQVQESILVQKIQLRIA